MFVIWLIPEAVAQNLAPVIVGRFFDGFAGSAFLAVAAGSVVDLFDPSEIDFPMMIFSASPFLGPVGGPVMGGFINQFTSWYAVTLQECPVLVAKNVIMQALDLLHPPHLEWRSVCRGGILHARDIPQSPSQEEGPREAPNHWGRSMVCAR